MNELTFEQAIEKAKVSIVNKFCGKNDDMTPSENQEFQDLFNACINRKWLTCSVDSYKSESNRISFIVCEGSPVKGYVVVNYGADTVTAVDAWGKQLQTWTNLYRTKNNT